MSAIAKSSADQPAARDGGSPSPAPGPPDPRPLKKKNRPGMTGAMPSRVGGLVRAQEQANR